MVEKVFQLLANALLDLVTAFKIRAGPTEFVLFENSRRFALEGVWHMLRHAAPYVRRSTYRLRDTSGAVATTEDVCCGAVNPLSRRGHGGGAPVSNPPTPAAGATRNSALRR